MAKSADAALAKYKAKEKAKAKAAQAKADAKTANKSAAKPKSPNSNVKVVPSMTAAERAQRNISESARLHYLSFGTKDIMAHAEKRVSGLPKNPTAKIRTNPGISGKGGANVGGLYKPMGGGMNWSTK
jgi:membrane protein involved in colicin uptake